MSKQFVVLLLKWSLGIVESTGMTTQVRTSYLPSDILWGYHLAPLMTYQQENRQHKIDYTHFQQVIPLHSMPSCSAKQHHEQRGSDKVYDADNSTSGYFPTVVRTNTVPQSVLKRMRNSIRRRTTSRDIPSRSSGSLAKTAAGKKSTEQTKPVVDQGVGGGGIGSVSSL